MVNAAPDGYTLLLGANNETVIARLFNANVKYDGERDLTPISKVASQPMVIVAAVKTGIKNVDEFIAAARKNPGKFSYGTSGIGTALHLAGELAQEKAGINMVHVPYRGVAPLTADLLSGNVDFGVFVLSSGLPHIQSGKMIAIGITEPTRSPVAPNIPPLGDNPAFTDFDISSWFGLFAPAKLSAALTDRLRRELGEALKSTELRQRFAQSGATVAPSDADLRKFMAGDVANMRRIVKFANIKPE